jgi:hypothetical protein
LFFFSSFWGTRFRTVLVILLSALEADPFL